MKTELLTRTADEDRAAHLQSHCAAEVMMCGKQGCVGVECA